MVTVRRATLEDSTDVLLWRNDRLSVKMSLSGIEVTPRIHEQWFPSTLNSDDHVHLIGEFAKPDDGIEKLGVCRFDRQQTNRWIVSINLNPNLRGRGLSGKFLGQGIEFLNSCLASKNVTLVAEIREQNAPSVKIFQENGFVRVGKLAGVIYMERKLVQ